MALFPDLPSQGTAAAVSTAYSPAASLEPAGPPRGVQQRRLAPTKSGGMGQKIGLVGGHIDVLVGGFNIW